MLIFNGHRLRVARIRVQVHIAAWGRANPLHKRSYRTANAKTYGLPFFDFVLLDMNLTIFDKDCHDRLRFSGTSHWLSR